LPPAQADTDSHVIACHIPLDELRAAEPVIKIPDAPPPGTAPDSPQATA
jgi:hypothetical protein